MEALKNRGDCSTHMLYFQQHPTGGVGGGLSIRHSLPPKGASAFTVFRSVPPALSRESRLLGAGTPILLLIL